MTSGTGAAIKVEEISPVKKRISFEIPWEEVKKELDAAYRTVGRKARVKGFRPGKTPRRILETYFKEDAEGEAIQNMVSRSFEEAVQSAGIVPVARPEISQNGIQSERSFTYSATVEVEPVVEPKGYTGLELPREDAAVTDQDIQNRLEELRNLYSTLADAEAERPVRMGDFLVIDFQGSLGGNVRSELTEAGFRIEIGSKRLVPGFEEALVGMKKGESKEFTVTFPGDYHIEEFAAQPITFHVTVRDVKVKVLPDLDDQFIKNFEQYESMEALRADIRKSLEQEKSARAKANLRKAIIDRLLELNPFDVPEAYVERQIFSMMVETQRRMVINGMDPDNAARMAANLHDQFRDEAVRLVRSGILLQKIAEKESITVDEAEIDDRIRETATRYGRDFESTKASYEKENMTERLRDQILEEKTLDFIESRANIR
ncbi:MAG TPA: trigger factor [Syntrophales bacterium]|nr:trigger factor [Syntrophales bacterium]HNS54004.1 trigger factor [Syntrophales bacterium]